MLEETGLAPEKEAAETPAAQPSDGPEPSPAAAEMLKSMREKGLLTEDEYEELYRRQAKYEAQQAMKEGVPAWLRDWTFGGDVRFRYDRRDFGSLGFDETYTLGKQNIDVVSDAEPRTRQRESGPASPATRRREEGGSRSSPSASASRRAADSSYGTTSTTGGTSFSASLDSNPRSPNVTLGDYFSYKNIFIDRAYLTYEPGWAPALADDRRQVRQSVRVEADRHRLHGLGQRHPARGRERRATASTSPRTGSGSRASPPRSPCRNAAPITIRYNSTTRTADAMLPDIDEQNPILLGFQGGLHGRPMDWVQTGARVSYYDLSQIGTRLAAATEDLGNGGARDRQQPALPPARPEQSVLPERRVDGPHARNWSSTATRASRPGARSTRSRPSSSTCRC